MTVQLEKKLFTVDDYYKMGETGVLSADERFELINGEIIKMSPAKSPHASVVDFLSEELIHKFYKKAIIRTQNPIRLSNFSEPEPDILVAKYKKDRYRKSHPTPADIHLLIEVADSTLGTDRRIKIPLYAAAGIQEYWIANIPHKQIEIYREPENDTYLKREIVKMGEKAVCPAINFEVNVNEVFWLED